MLRRIPLRRIPLRRVMECLALLITAAPLVAHAQSSPSKRQSEIAATIDAVTSLTLDPSRVANVSDLTIQRDVGALQLSGGRLYFCRPIAGRTVAALYLGSGTFRYRPPLQVEREQLGRYFGGEELAERFTSAVIFFTDQTEKEILARTTVAPASVPDGAHDAIERFIESIADRERRDLEPSFLRALLNGVTEADGVREGIFFTQMEGSEQGPLFFEIDPYNEEEVGFLRRSRGSVDDMGRDDINRHHLQDEYLALADGSESTADLTFDRYRINASIARDLKFAASYDIEMTMLRDSVRWLHFYLSPALAVDSITWGGGEPAEYYRAKDGYVVWVRNSRHLKKGEKGALTMTTIGEPMVRRYNTIYMPQSSMWYPRHDFMQRARFDLTYTTPKQFLFASAGDPVGEPLHTEDGTTISRWKLDRPSRNVSFNIGRFYETKATPDSLPAISVLRDVEMAENVATQVAWDVENSMRFFRHLYGPPQAPFMSVTQIPFSHGEAFPGLIHLSWLSFEGNLRDDIARSTEVTRDGFNEFFRAHEVAHQWWGIGVDYRSYHDQWLSEGIASYSGLMYVQASLKDNDMFFDWLRYYREKIVENRTSIFGKGQEAGPIWLGHRTSSSTTAGDYDLIIYKKGAWVMHMLRCLLIDVNTLSDEKFKGLMRDFYASYAGRSASTGDFQRLAEKHAGGKLDWFFEQWIYGTAMPTYAFSYKVTSTPEGKFLLKCRVDATDVPATFKSYPMFTIDFGQKRLSRVRRPVQGARTEFEVLLPAKPEGVIFNDFESVLCTAEEVDWKE